MSIGTLVASRTGIFFGWWVVFVSAALIFLTGGTFFYGFSVLFSPIVNEFGWSRVSVSFAFSLRSEVGGIAARHADGQYRRPVSGSVHDKRFVMAAANALLTLAVLSFATVYEPWQILLALPLFGLGWGGVIPTQPSLQAEVFGPRAFGAVYDQKESYRLSLVILAAFGFLVALLILTLRRHSEPRTV